MRIETELERFRRLQMRVMRKALERFEEKMGGKAGWNRKRLLPKIMHDLREDMYLIGHEALYGGKKRQRKLAVDIVNRAVMLWGLLGK